MDQTPLALAAVGYSDGLRAFVHSGDGKIRVVGNEAEVDDILSSTHSKNSKDGKWEPGTLRASCSTQSNLAAFEGQDGLILGLCCQLPDGTLALYHRDYKWRPVTGFTGIQKARPGTALVTVSSHIARRVVLFFQDEKDYVCCRRATWQETDWVWESAVRLAEAVPGCGIAATSWKRDGDEGLEEIGLYYQDAHSQTVELRLSFSACGPSDARSAPIEPIPVKEAQRSISMQVLAAASYGSPPDIRLFLREDRNVWEFQRGRDSERLWHRQSVNLKDFAPRSNLAALARTSGDSDRVVIDLLYWSANEALNHKLFVHRRGWQDTTSVGPPPVITPPQSTDPHDLAYSENAIRFEASSDLIGIRDALWTLEGHAKWLKIDLVAKKLKRDLLEALCEAASEVSKRAFDSEPLERIIQHIATLGNLAIRLSRLHEGDDPARNDLLQQCKMQAARVETAIEAWPNMCKALHSSIKVAELNTDNMPLGNAGAFEDRLDDIREVISSTYNRGVEMLSEQMDKAVAADNRLDAAIKTRDDARQRAAEMKGFRAVGRVLTLGLTVIFEQVSGLNDDIETQLNAARAADRQAVRYREERDKAMEDGRSLLLAFARVEKQREDLDLDKIRLLVRLNSANEKQLRRKVVASKTCADHTAKCFSTLLVQSATLPLQSSAEGFARALLDMLKIFDGSDAPDGFRAHVRHSGDLRRRLEAIAA